MRPANYFSVFTVVLSALLLIAPAAWAKGSLSKLDMSPDVYKVKIDPFVSLGEAADSMRLRANALNLKLVAELPLSAQAEAVTGKPQRTVTIFQFCDAATAVQLIELNMDFSVYMPCRIALIEDVNGQGWLVMMDVNVDVVAKETGLTPALKARVLEVRKMLKNIMQAGANGEL